MVYRFYTIPCFQLFWPTPNGLDLVLDKEMQTYE